MIKKMIMIATVILMSSSVFALDKDLGDLIKESRPIISRLEKGETVQIGRTKIIKRNGMVYGIGNYTEEEKQQFEKERLERLERNAKLNAAEPFTTIKDRVKMLMGDFNETEE